MFRRILVPVDGSKFAEQAISFATRIAAASDAKLELALVHIVYPPVNTAIAGPVAFGGWEHEQRRREADYLSELAQRIAASTGRVIDPIALGGDVVSVLEHEIEERGVDLVVMTTHGRAGLARAWLGSVADALIRHVDVPVLLIRPGEEEFVSADRPAPAFTHVLIALDGSEHAERTLGPATALAQADSARVTLLRVVSTPIVPSPYIPFAAAPMPGDLKAFEAEARAYIDDQVQELTGRDIEATGEVLFDYSPVRAVLRFAESHGVDLIALGTHGRGPVTRFVLGSVSDKVVRAANVPVLVC